MWKLINWIFVVLILVGVASAAICEDRVIPGQNCTMISSVLSCDAYTYFVYNTTSKIIDNRSLTQLNDSIYYFTFNQTYGDYIVRFCDNSSRQIRVVSESDMFDVAIVLGILGFGALLFGLSWFYSKNDDDDDEKNKDESKSMLDTVFKVVFKYALLIIPVLGVFLFGVLINIASYNDGGGAQDLSDISSLMETGFIVSLALCMLILFIIGVVILMKLVLSIRQWRNDKDHGRR